jgi:hypothetical protein
MRDEEFVPVIAQFPKVTTVINGFSVLHGYAIVDITVPGALTGLLSQMDVTPEFVHSPRRWGVDFRTKCVHLSSW